MVSAAGAVLPEELHSAATLTPQGQPQQLERIGGSLSLSICLLHIIHCLNLSSPRSVTVSKAENVYAENQIQ